MTATAPPLGVYVHWPYCARICPYCDFNVVRDRGRASEQAALAAAIVADLRARRALTGPRRLASIFFGGGTPSLMDPALAARDRRGGACACGRRRPTSKSRWRPIPPTPRPAASRPSPRPASTACRWACSRWTTRRWPSSAATTTPPRPAGGRHRRAPSSPRLSIDLIYALPGPDARAPGGRAGRGPRAGRRARLGLPADHRARHRLRPRGAARRAGRRRTPTWPPTSTRPPSEVLERGRLRGLRGLQPCPRAGPPARGTT